MQSNSWAEFLANLKEKTKLLDAYSSVLRSVLFAAVIAAGILFGFMRAASAETVPDVATLVPKIQSTTTALATTTTAMPEMITVHVVGSVAKPGVFRIQDGARVADVLNTAGGVTTTADTEALNLAAVVTDGSQVRVPEIGTTTTGPLILEDTGTSTSENEVSLPLNPNTATEQELIALSGIGPALAGRIVSHRESNGPFASADDLLAVVGIGPAKLEAFRADLSF